MKLRFCKADTLVMKQHIAIHTSALCFPLTVRSFYFQEAKCAYVIIIMAIYWMTEVLPMAITALLPIVLMPPLGVMGAKDLAKNYLKVG